MDEEIFKEFIKLLPNQEVGSFLNRLLLGGKFTYKYMTMFLNYDVYHNETLDQYTNQKINKEWIIFNESFEALQEFLEEHYTLPNGFYTRHSVKWNTHKDELYELAKDFEIKYLNFVVLAKKELKEIKIKELIKKLGFKETTQENEESKKYSNANEDILLKTLGIKIKGNYILRGDSKKWINFTDKALIYFLYYKLITNSDECFSIKDLSKEETIKKSERYIKNRITFINQSIGEIASKQLKLKIGIFIKNERKRGYHLNPKILLIKRKK